MQLFDFGGRGAMYWDNAPLIAPFAYEANVGPHALTTRITYTPPSGRMAYIESISIELQRTNAAAPVGRAGIQVNFISSARGTAVVLTDEINDNAIPSPRNMMGPAPLGLITDLDVLQINTFDVSTGGAVFYFATLKVCEFDRQYPSLVPQF